jgi:hypothetical protein
MEEPNNCPKPNCGRPESTHRYSAGKKLSICGNGHSWDAAEIAAQRAKAREAQSEELKKDYERIEVRPYRYLKERLEDLDIRIP